MGLYVTMFVAGMLTILLPCILPLVPIVLGVSIAGKSKLRPLFTILGMLISFVGFTFLLATLLQQFVGLTDYIRVSTYYVLLLFGLGFLTHNKQLQLTGAVLGGFFFYSDGWIVMTIAQTIGATAMEVGGWVATRIQQLGTNVQQKASGELGQDNPITAFIIGLTMGLVWVPCAGPALGFALTLVQDQPGIQSALLLLAYGVGTAVPLTLIGYGGQAAVLRSRKISQYSGRIKQVSGAILIITALALQYGWLRSVESFLVSNTRFGNIGVELETQLFGDEIDMN
jgi:cytochrome c-type biogenesis protein